jgi:hypothetical protein
MGARIIGQGIRIAAVTLPTGGVGNNQARMLDLVTGVVQGWGGTGGSTEHGPAGPGAYGSTSNAFGFVWPAMYTSEVQTYGYCSAAIVNYRTSTYGQAFMASDNNGAARCAANNNGTLQALMGGVNIFQVGALQWPNVANSAINGHVYFMAWSFRCTGPAGFPNPKMAGVLLDMTTGQLWLGTSGGNYVATTFCTTGQMCCATYSAAGTTDKNRVCAAMMGFNYLNIAELLAWAKDPWSLWYAPNVTQGVSRVTSAPPLTVSNSPALMIGV